MSVKVRLASLQKKAENSLGNLLKDVDKIAKNIAQEGRQLIESTTVTTIKNHEAFLKNLETPGSPKFAKDFEDHLNKCTTVKDANGKPLVDTLTLRDEYNKWRMATNKVAGSRVIPGMQQSHKDHTIVGQRAFVLYTDLVKAGRSLSGSKPVDQQLIAKNSFFAEAYRRLYMTAEAISRAPDNILGNSSVIEDMTAAIEYFERVTTQSQWEAIKSKEINILAGIGEQELELVLTQPEPKKAAEYEIAATIGRLYGEESGNKEKIRQVLNISNFTKLEGSKVLEDELVEQVTALALGRMPKAYKKTTKTTKKSSTSQVVKGSTKLKRLVKKKNSLKIAALAPAKLSEKGSESTTRELLKIKNLINKRLPAEVRRNMGRPALKNQTGTFSNSVELETLRPSKTGISGDYTYMLTGGGISKNRAGVYETFENTGKRSWPGGYNPKALITKSIRNLAIQYTDKKFTYLRRI